MVEKQKIYWDVDDVVLDSANTIIQMINEKYDLNKKSEDLKDYGMVSIYPGFKDSKGRDELRKMFDSDEFWNKVSMHGEFIMMLRSGLLGNYDNYFVTKGTKKNHEKKIEFLKNVLEAYDVGEDGSVWFDGINGSFNDNRYIGLVSDRDAIGPDDWVCNNDGSKHKIDKSEVNMAGGIQIDDVFACLENTNAKIKILVTNDRVGDFNLGTGVGSSKNGKKLLDNLYICRNLDEVRQILEFNLQFKL